MITIEVIHRFELPPGMCSEVTRHDLDVLRNLLMSVISDKIAEVTTSVDAALVRVQDDVTALNTKIAELQAQVDSGLATPADIAALDELKVKLDALDPTSPVVIPEPPPAP